MADPAPGLYESLLSEDLRELLDNQPELRSVFAKIEAEEEPARYAAFLARVIEQALRLEPDSETRLRLCNAIIERLATAGDGRFLARQRLVQAAKPMLLEITPAHYLGSGMP